MGEIYIIPNSFEGEVVFYYYIACLIMIKKIFFNYTLVFDTGRKYILTFLDFL